MHYTLQKNLSADDVGLKQLTIVNQLSRLRVPATHTLLAKLIYRNLFFYDMV